MIAALRALLHRVRSWVVSLDRNRDGRLSSDDVFTDED
jgi:hypothetical protein